MDLNVVWKGSMNNPYFNNIPDKIELNKFI